MLSPFILLNVITFHIAERYHLLWNSMPQEVSSDGKHRFSVVTDLWGFLATWVCVLLTSLCVWVVGRIHLEIKVTTTVTFSDCCHHKETCYTHQGSPEQQVCGLLLGRVMHTQVMCCWRRVIHKSCAAGGGWYTSHALLEEGDTQVMCCWRRVIHKSCAAGEGWYTSCAAGGGWYNNTSHMLLEKGDTQVVLLEEGDTHTSYAAGEGWYTSCAAGGGWYTHVICCWRRVIHKLCCWRRVIHTRHMLLEKGDTQVVLLEEGDTHRSCAAAEGDRLIHTQVMSYACCWRRVIHAQVMSFACWQRRVIH